MNQNTFAQIGIGEITPIELFDPNLWLSALTEIGGGYALGADRRLTFLVDHCDGEALTSVMAQIVGHAERQEAIKGAIEDRQNGSTAA
jgi:hypothetical protein